VLVKFIKTRNHSAGFSVKILKVNANRTGLFLFGKSFGLHLLILKTANEYLNRSKT
jgi:hypothetical protein